MKRTKKVLVTALTLVFSTLLFIGCRAKESNKKEIKETTQINIVVPNGVPATSISKLIKEKKNEENYSINYTIENTSEVLATTVMKGEPDIAIVPSNLAAQGYNKDLGYKLVGTTGFGALYLISTEGNISIEDLKGKEIYNIAKGLTPDIVFRALLNKNGIKEDEISLNYVGSPSELAPAILGGKAKYAVVPEPVLTTIKSKNENVTVIADLNKMWKEAFETKQGFPQASIIAKEYIIKNHKDFLNKFLSNVLESINWVNSNPEKAAEYSVDNGSKVEKVILEKSIKSSNIQFSTSKDSKDEYNKYFKVLKDQNPKSIGGEIPDENFFY
ncbi:ABC transporter substrate-binding protein [Clostridium carnis]